jgi:hypothetical protein
MVAKSLVEPKLSSQMCRLMACRLVSALTEVAELWAASVIG